MIALLSVVGIFQSSEGLNWTKRQRKVGVALSALLVGVGHRSPVLRLGLTPSVLLVLRPSNLEWNVNYQFSGSPAWQIVALLSLHHMSQFHIIDPIKQLYMYMFMYMYVYMYLYMYVYVYVNVVCVCIHVHVHVHLHLPIYIYLSMSLSLIYISISTYLYLYLCLYLHIYIYISISHLIGSVSLENLNNTFPVTIKIQPYSTHRTQQYFLVAMPTTKHYLHWWGKGGTIYFIKRQRLSKNNKSCYYPS